MAAGTYVSPGVYSIETDVSDIVPNIASTIAALVGHSNKGNVDDIVLVTNKDDFIAEYGEPETDKYFHYTALAFLQQGKTLYCQRVANGALYGGCDIFETVDPVGFVTGYADKALDSNDDALFKIFAKDPGTWNANIGITITDVTGAEDASAKPPILPTNSYTFKINVYYKNEDGGFDIVESWTVSRKEKVDGYGAQLYLETRINGYSKYIYVVDNTAEADTVLPHEYVDLPTATAGTKLISGSDGTTPTSSDIVLGWGVFENPDELDIRILLNGGETSVEVQQEMVRIAAARADCIAILDMPWAYANLSVASSIDWRQQTQNINSSYAALYDPWLRINDPYNDTLVYVPPSGYVGAQIAYNDYVAQVWDAPAGFNRGILQNVQGVNHIFTQGERDLLYEAQINPIQKFRGEGIVIWGQKTLQVKASALSRVNVRRLLIIMEKAISTALRYFVMEGNSELTRFRIVSIITEYMDLLSAQGAFQTEVDAGYSIICDERNNTPAVIDRNELHVDVFVKPRRTAEFIQLRTIVTSSGASFEELVSKGGII